MGMFDVVEFDAKDVKAVMDGTASRGMVFAVLTSQTCGEACWHAVEDVCRCSCGGKNHGCLRVAGGTRPERTSRIDGHVYKLVGVGRLADLYKEARAINDGQGWKHVDKARLTSVWTSDGEKQLWQQYRYHWSETDKGAPARLKSASASQRNWKELDGWKDEHTVHLLWQRVQMPPRCTELVVDDETGLPLADQSPK